MTEGKGRPSKSWVGVSDFSDWVLWEKTCFHLFSFSLLYWFPMAQEVYKRDMVQKSQHLIFVYYLSDIFLVFVYLPPQTVVLFLTRRFGRSNLSPSSFGTQFLLTSRLWNTSGGLMWCSWWRWILPWVTEEAKGNQGMPVLSEHLKFYTPQNWIWIVRPLKQKFWL